MFLRDLLPFISTVIVSRKKENIRLKKHRSFENRGEWTDGSTDY